MVGLLSLTHFLVRDKNGPVRGASGLRYRIACSTKRAYLATATNQEAATDRRELTNCPGCLAEIERLKIKKRQGIVLN